MSKIYEALENASRESMLPKIFSPRLPKDERWHLPPRNQPAEKMIGFYQRVEALLPNADAKIIQFLSSNRREGTSGIVKQFAGICALRMHKSVLVLDADGINPVQHILFGVTARHSLDEAITNGVPLQKSFCQALYPGLTLCRAAGNSVSSSQVLNRDGLWKVFRTRFDLVIIDSPPLSVSSDGLALVRKADGVVLVIEAEKTRWPVVQALKDSIAEHGGNILGVVLNKRRYYIPAWIYKWL